jgi:hypothetical protein
METASAYFDPKTNRHRFEAGSVIDGRKVGGRFTTEAVFNSLLMGNLVAMSVAPARPVPAKQIEAGAQRLAARLGRIARKGNPNQDSDGESLLRRAAWAA